LSQKVSIDLFSLCVTFIITPNDIITYCKVFERYADTCCETNKSLLAINII